MPRLKKSKLAAKAREQRKKLKRLASDLKPATWMLMAVGTNSPENSDALPETVKTEPMDPVTDESPNLFDFKLAPPSPESTVFAESIPPEPTPPDLIDIKEEPIELDLSPHFQVAAPDPLKIQSCLFCFRELSNGLGAALEDSTLRKKIEFVLVAKFNFLKLPCKVPCCISCVQMFDMFYEFKKNCLAALTKQDELRKAKALESMEPPMPPVTKRIKVVQSLPKLVETKSGEQNKMVETPELAEIKQLLPEVTVVKVAKQPAKVDDQPKPVGEPTKPLKSMIVFKCSVCPAAFVNEDEHGYHMNEHLGVYPYKCGIVNCKQAFPNPKLCSKHEVKCATSPKTCNICSLVFLTAAEFEEHNIAHTPSVCPRCKGIFALAQDCENHMTVCQGVEDDPQPSTSAKETDKQRSTENSVDSESSDQDQDEQTDSNGARPCRNCGHKFPLAGDILFKHQRNCGALRTRVKCPRCEKCFSRKGTLEAHLKRHDGIAPFRCGKPGCKRTFFSQSACASHEEGCGTLGFVCDVCGASLSTQISLKAHREKHEEPKLQCSQCEKRFHDKTSLQKHMSVHSEERKFECQTCGKRFKSYEANRVHQRIHTKEKPYACPECDKRFTYNCSLKAHLEKKACIMR